MFFSADYTMTDCPLFTEEDCRERPDTIGGAPRASRIGFPRRLRNLGPEAPGKQAYVRTMRKLYRDRIEDFNTTYGMTFQSFDVLAAAVRHKKPVPCGFHRITQRPFQWDNVRFDRTVTDRHWK